MSYCLILYDHGNGSSRVGWVDFRSFFSLFRCSPVPIHPGVIHHFYHGEKDEREGELDCRLDKLVPEQVRGRLRCEHLSTDDASDGLVVDMVPLSVLQDHRSVYGASSVAVLKPIARRTMTAARLPRLSIVRRMIDNTIQLIQRRLFAGLIQLESWHHRRKVSSDFEVEGEDDGCVDLACDRADGGESIEMDDEELGLSSEGESL